MILIFGPTGQQSFIHCSLLQKLVASNFDPKPCTILICVSFPTAATQQDIANGRIGRMQNWHLGHAIHDEGALRRSAVAADSGSELVRLCQEFGARPQAVPLAIDAAELPVVPRIDHVPCNDAKVRLEQRHDKRQHQTDEKKSRVALQILDRPQRSPSLRPARSCMTEPRGPGGDAGSILRQT